MATFIDVANWAAVIGHSSILFEQHKMLPTYAIFDESRYFQPAESDGRWLEFFASGKLKKFWPHANPAEALKEA